VKERTLPTSTGLEKVVRAVLRAAEQQTYIVSRQIRDELRRAELPEAGWKEIVQRAGSALSCRNGRYYFVPSGPTRMRARARHDQRQLEAIQQAVRSLIRKERKKDRIHDERRIHKRIDFARPVLIQAEDGRLLHGMSREISLSGIRLVGTCRLLGQKLRVWIPYPEVKGQTYGFAVRVLWSAEIASQLYENGGVLLERLENETVPDEE
jgi:hypothetical protein